MRKVYGSALLHCLQAAAEGAMATQQQQQEQQQDEAMTGVGQQQMGSYVSMQPPDDGLSSLEGHLAARQGRRQVVSGKSMPAAVAAGQTTGGNDDWGDEQLGEDLLPM
jgi:high-affinity Fe2+/Pb2+ permease